MTYAEYRRVWVAMTEDERNAVRDKCQWEHMGTWAVLNEWPSLIPRRLRTLAEHEQGHR